MALSLALMALLFSVPAFFLSVYVWFRIIFEKKEEPQILNPSVAENTARALSAEHSQESFALDRAAKFDYGIGEDNF